MPVAEFHSQVRQQLEVYEDVIGYVSHVASDFRQESTYLSDQLHSMYSATVGSMQSPILEPLDRETGTPAHETDGVDDPMTIDELYLSPEEYNAPRDINTIHDMFDQMNRRKSGVKGPRKIQFFNGWKINSEHP